MAKVLCAPRSGRVGNEVYVRSRWGQIVRKFVPPRNPRTEFQTANRQAFGALATQWHALPPEARFAWAAAAIRDQTGLSGFHYFMKLNPARVHIGLGRLTMPPSQRPSFDTNPVAELVVTNTGGTPSVQLHVPSPPAQFTLVEVAAPLSAGVSHAWSYRYLGLLPAPVNGWSDITALVLAHFGGLIPGQVLFVRTRQQTDGWMDTPKVTSALIPSG